MAVVALSAASAGCILPKDIDLSAVNSAARSTQSAPYGVAGGDVAGDIRIGSKALEFGADVGLTWRVDRDSPALGQVLGLIGYAYAPRPFEGRLGWDFTGGAGWGDRPVDTGTAPGPMVLARGSLLFRLTPSNTVWSEDKHTTTEVFLVAGGQGLLFVPSDHESRPPVLEYAGILGARMTFYDNGSP